MYIGAYLIDCKVNVVIPAIWLANFDAEICFNHGINRNKIYKAFFSRQYKLADFNAPLRHVFSDVDDAVYRAKICSMKFAKDAAEQSSIKRRRVEPFTCSTFPNGENQTEPLRLMSEQALLDPIARPRIKTEIELVQLQQQIGDLLRKIPIVDMGDILEEVFTIDVEDFESHEYDERFAALFGMNQLEFEVKPEPQEEQNGEINPPSDIDSEPCTSATALARYGASSNTSQHMQTHEDATVTVANEDTSGMVWYIDCDEEMGGRTYDEHFARHFGLLQNPPQFQVKQEDVNEHSDGSSHNHGERVVSNNPIVNTIAEQTITQPTVDISARDPISQHYEFNVDFLGNRHYPIWNITVPFHVVRTLLSYNTSPEHQDAMHDRLFVQVLVLGSLNAGGGSPQDVMQAAQSLFSLRVNGDPSRMARFPKHIDGLRKILLSKTNAK